MGEPEPGSWRENTSGRERVRYVVELLEEATTVQEIANEADVSRTTAHDELRRLESDDWVLQTTVDGKQAYDLNPVRMLLDEITDLIGEYSREELEAKLTELKADEEELAEGYGVESLSEFREQLAEKDYSSEDLRERRNVIATWEALNTELGLVRHALQLYDDVVELSSLRTDTRSFA
ncbi:winged helix-turn-helix domain-containing protein [Natronorarus salvus]|uniref:winged helix-turn-helix domain-containing protein n=1 Tax=Natronorarus salvus TaxID=3117733 RepID=UPI003907E861